jgi:hypothetical protein
MPGLCHLCLGAPGDRRVPAYNIHVCHPCWRTAAEGWPRHYEGSLFAALERAGLLIPDRNDRDLLPRTYKPPADHPL